MDFTETHLPDRSLFTAAFTAGFAQYQARHGDAANTLYARGPVAMARLIHEHGGDCRQLAVAACLAGPAIFTAAPDRFAPNRLTDFGREICGFGLLSEDDFLSMVPTLSGDARLFFQASAIMLMDQVAEDKKNTSSDMEQAHATALKLYSAARGDVDVYHLDTRFEIAAMKLTSKIAMQDVFGKNAAKTSVRPLWVRVHAQTTRQPVKMRGR